MKFNIEINCNDTIWYESIPEIDEIIKQSCINAVKASGLRNSVNEVEISVLLADDDFIQELNNRHRGKDKPTNVLSFPSEELTAGNYPGLSGYVMLGDIILSYQTIEKEAKAEKKKIEDHLAHLVIHGTLHLLGYDHIDEQDAEKMEGLEVKILAGIGIKDPYK